MKLTIRKSSQRKYLIAIAVFFISLSNNSLATSLESSSKCRTHFKGTVVKVTESGAPFSIQNQKQKVTFEVGEDLGSQEEVKSSYSLNLIKGGPYKFKVGSEYEVYADSGYLCHSKASN